MKVILQQFLMILRLPFFGKGRVQPFVHFSIVFWSCMVSIINFLIFHPSGGISSRLAAFLQLIVFKIVFILREMSKFKVLLVSRFVSDFSWVSDQILKMFFPWIRKPHSIIFIQVRNKIIFKELFGTLCFCGKWDKAKIKSIEITSYFPYKPYRKKYGQMRGISTDLHFKKMLIFMQKSVWEAVIFVYVFLDLCAYFKTSFRFADEIFWLAMKN